jgi:hypothetical protein
VARRDPHTGHLQRAALPDVTATTHSAGSVCRSAAGFESFSVHLERGHREERTGPERAEPGQSRGQGSAGGGGRKGATGRPATGN